MKSRINIMVFCAVVGSLAAADVAHAQSGSAVPVTVDNFIRAESDTYIGNFAKEAGGASRPAG